MLVIAAVLSMGTLTFPSAAVALYFLETTLILNYFNNLGFDYTIFDFCFSWKAGSFELQLCLGEQNTDTADKHFIHEHVTRPTF